MAEQLITVEGVDEVCREFREAPPRLIPYALLKGLEAAGWVLQGAIESRTPVGGSIVGGRSTTGGALIADLDMNITLDQNFRGGVVKVGFGKQGYVARFVEYGHRMIGHKPRNRELGVVQPHPFMRPAADDAAEAAVAAFNEAFLAALAEGGLLDAA
jgi:hypothetical protein